MNILSKFGAKPPISNDIPTVFGERLPIQPWGALGYMPGVPDFHLAQGPGIGARCQGVWGGLKPPRFNHNPPAST